MRSLRTRLVAAVSMPARDTLAALNAAVERGFVGLGLLLLGLVAGWFVYVPIHELLHAAGCVATGGTISQLEIDGKYGGALLARVFPFVVSGSEYAGRLSGFDTRGNDAIYFATDFAPYLLTLWPGVWALRRAARRKHAFWTAWWLPWALAPFVSLIGDAYEIGSLLLTRLPPWSALEPRTTILGDDVFLVAEGLRAAGAGGVAWSGLVLAFALGTAWALATYALAAALARRLAQPDPADLATLLGPPPRRRDAG